MKANVSPRDRLRDLPYQMLRESGMLGFPEATAQKELSNPEHPFWANLDRATFDLLRQMIARTGTLYRGLGFPTREALDSFMDSIGKDKPPLKLATGGPISLTALKDVADDFAERLHTGERRLPNSYIVILKVKASMVDYHPVEYGKKFAQEKLPLTDEAEVTVPQIPQRAIMGVEASQIILEPGDRYTHLLRVKSYRRVPIIGLKESYEN